MKYLNLLCQHEIVVSYSVLATTLLEATNAERIRCFRIIMLEGALDVVLELENCRRAK